MVTLLGDLHFWTLREDVVIKDADVGAYRYQEKGSVNKERVYYPQRRHYIESRCGTIVLKNTRPTKLRDSLKELEELLTRERIVWQGWLSYDKYQLFFATGLIVVINTNSSTGNVTSVAFDKYLQGRLLSDGVVDGAFSSRYLIFTYNDCRATLVHLAKKPQDESRPGFRLSSGEPKIITCDGIGPAGRRFERRLSLNLTEDKVCFWWKSGEDEVYPWSPLNKDRDRANVLVYSLAGSTMSLLCYCRTEMSPLSVVFSRNQPDVILTVEQGFDKKGGVTVLSCVYEVKKGSLHRISVTSIPLEAPLTAHSHNPSETRLLLACNNGVLALHCESRGMTHVTKAGLIPSCISWLDSGSLLFVSNDRGQMQCFDMALSLVRMQILLDTFNPLRILDFSEYFCHQPLLERISWGSPPNKEDLDASCPSIPLLFLQFANGPLACLRIGTASCPFSPNFKEGATSVENSANVYPPNVSPSLLISQYVKYRQFDEAVNLLVSLSWETEGSLALKCILTIVSALLRLPLNAQRESQLESALASFLVPAVALSSTVEEEFGPPVRAMTRRFFFKVLRQGHLEKAYRLALDLKDHDCFLSVHRVARCHGNHQLESLALENAREVATRSPWSGSCSSFLCSDSEGSHSGSCSESCSTCSDSEENLHENGKEAADKKNEATNATQDPSRMGQINGHLNLKEGSQQPQLASHEDKGSPFQSEGVITINIRQGSKMPILENTLAMPPITKSLPHSSLAKQAPPPAPKPRPSPEVGVASRGGSKAIPKVVKEVFYSEQNKKYIDEDKLSYFVNSNDLQRQYEQAVFQEVTTEEEDGGTVKVVHFGVV